MQFAAESGTDGIIMSAHYSPEIKGIKGHSENTYFTFNVSDKGHVYAYSADTCLNAIIDSGYKVTPKLYKDNCSS